MTKKTSLMRMKELAEVSGVRQSTIKYYTELGILPFIQKEEGLTRRYDKSKAITRLRVIARLKKQSFTMEQIVARFNK